MDKEQILTAIAAMLNGGRPCGNVSIQCGDSKYTTVIFDCDGEPRRIITINHNPSVPQRRVRASLGRRSDV